MEQTVFLPNLSLMVRRMAWWSRGSVLKLFMINKASTFNVLISQALYPCATTTSCLKEPFCLQLEGSCLFLCSKQILETFIGICQLLFNEDEPIIYQVLKNSIKMFLPIFFLVYIPPMLKIFFHRPQVREYLIGNSFIFFQVCKTNFNLMNNIYLPARLHLMSSVTMYHCRPPISSHSRVYLIGTKHVIVCPLLGFVRTS